MTIRAAERELKVLLEKQPTVKVCELLAAAQDHAMPWSSLNLCLAGRCTVGSDPLYGILSDLYHDLARCSGPEMHNPVLSHRRDLRRYKRIIPILESILEEREQASERRNAAKTETSSPGLATSRCDVVRAL